MDFKTESQLRAELAKVLGMLDAEREKVKELEVSVWEQKRCQDGLETSLAAAQAVIKQMREALESCTPADYTTSHVIHPSFDDALVEQALAIPADLAAEREKVAQLAATEKERNAFQDQCIALKVKRAELKKAEPVSKFNVGRFCLSEDDCIEQGIPFYAYERGVADAAEAFGRNAAPVVPDGMVMVPREPTQAMLLAAGSIACIDELAEDYRRLIAAAQEEA